MKIDSLNIQHVQYEIPGIEVSPIAFDREETAEDPAHVPYGLEAGVVSIPSPNGWRELLGLTATAPTPLSIDPPPTRPVSGAGNPSVSLSYPIYRNADAQRAASSASVQRMLAMLSQSHEAVARIRVRAKGGAW